MSQVTIVKRLEERIGDIRVELTHLLSFMGPLTVEQRARVDALFVGYVAASNGKLDFSNADEKLSPGNASYVAVQLDEVVDNKKTTLSINYSKIPPVPKEASAEYSKAG